MTCECERCHETRECEFHGRAADVDEEKAQNGEWLCDECVEPRAAELDDAISALTKFLEGG